MNFHYAEKKVSLPDNGFDYSLSEENILVLDHAKWSTETESSSKEQYIILVDDKLRAMIGEMPRGGLMEQPWHRGRKEIEKSIRGKIFTLDKEIIVHPGHGQDSSIGHEIKYNAYFGENARY